MQCQQKMQIAIDAQYWNKSWKALGNPRVIPKAEESSSKRSPLMQFPYFAVCDWLVWDLPIQ